MKSTAFLVMMVKVYNASPWGLVQTLLVQAGKGKEWCTSGMDVVGRFAFASCFHSVISTCQVDIRRQASDGVGGLTMTTSGATKGSDVGVCSTTLLGSMVRMLPRSQSHHCGKTGATLAA